MIATRYTPSGVRMRLHSVQGGPLNWLLLPGGLAYNAPNVLVREILGAGHFPSIENPLAVSQALQAFAMKVSGP